MVERASAGANQRRGDHARWIGDGLCGNALSCELRKACDESRDLHWQRCEFDKRCVGNCEEFLPGGMNVVRGGFDAESGGEGAEALLMIGERLRHGCELYVEGEGVEFVAELHGFQAHGRRDEVAHEVGERCDVC